MTDHIERIMNNIEEDITSQIPLKYLDNEGLEISNGWANICEFAYEGCNGATHKKMFDYNCVNNGKNCLSKLGLRIKSLHKNRK